MIKVQKYQQVIIPVIRPASKRELSIYENSKTVALKNQAQQKSSEADLKSTYGANNNLAFKSTATPGEVDNELFFIRCSLG
jgi:hypothetical protein